MIVNVALISSVAVNLAVLVWATRGIQREKAEIRRRNAWRVRHVRHSLAPRQ